MSLNWTDLPTDYTDRSWEGLQKYRQIQNEDDTVSFEDVTEYEDEEDSFFGASDANQMNGGMNAIVAEFGNLAPKSVPTAYTILASGWNNGVYSFESDYPSSRYDITEILPNDSTTDKMRTAWASAVCNGYKSTNVIEAHGTEPVININVTLMIRDRGEV